MVTTLRPGSVIKDDAVPLLLRDLRQPTFLTLNWKHFWQRTQADERFAIACFTLRTDQADEIPPLLRRFFHSPEFTTKASRCGTVARIAAEQVAYYRTGDPATYVLPLP